MKHDVQSDFFHYIVMTGIDYLTGRVEQIAAICLNCRPRSMPLVLAAN